MLAILLAALLHTSYPVTIAPACTVPPNAQVYCWHPPVTIPPPHPRPMLVISTWHRVAINLRPLAK